MCHEMFGIEKRWEGKDVDEGEEGGINPGDNSARVGKGGSAWSGEGKADEEETKPAFCDGWCTPRPSAYHHDAPTHSALVQSAAK